MEIDRKKHYYIGINPLVAADKISPKPLLVIKNNMLRGYTLSGEDLIQRIENNNLTREGNNFFAPDGDYAGSIIRVIDYHRK